MSMSDRKATEEEVLALIAQALQIDPGDLHPNSSSQDIVGWSSMTILQLLALFDEQLDLHLSAGDAQKLNSVPGILALVRDAGRLAA
jgi:acyl carrier protein